MIVKLNESFYSYHRLITDSISLAEQYPRILKNVTIGKTHDNRDILLIKLGLGKKKLLCCAGVHGRETINPIVLMGMIEYYAQAFYYFQANKKLYKSQFNKPAVPMEKEYENMIFCSCVYELLQTFTILFVPLLNPDGYMISLEGFSKIRDEELRKRCIAKNIAYPEWKYNARGVDINRNFPSRLWRPNHPSDRAASENETKALIRLFHDYNTMGFLDFHSRGKSIYYYRSMMSDQYNRRQLSIALRFQEITGYELVPPADEVDAGDSGGNTVHYYSERFYKPALTIETVDEEADFPLNYQYQASVFEELKLIIFEFGSMIL